MSDLWVRAHHLMNAGSDFAPAMLDQIIDEGDPAADPPVYPTASATLFQNMPGGPTTGLPVTVTIYPTITDAHSHGGDGALHGIPAPGTVYAATTEAPTPAVEAALRAPDRVSESGVGVSRTVEI